MRPHIERLEQRQRLAIAPLADVNPDAASSSPETGVLWNGRHVCSAEDAAHGRELWVTDGTAAGTRLFKDINPGPTGSDPANFTLHGQTLYFTADEGEHGVELFASGGAAGSTRLVA